MALSKTTQDALWSTAGALAGYYAARMLNVKEPTLLAMAGGIVATISRQRGEWNKIAQSLSD